MAAARSNEPIEPMTTRRFPAPWRADKIPGGYFVRDANGQALAYIYSRDSEAEALGIVIKARTMTIAMPVPWDRPLAQLSMEQMFTRILVDDICTLAGVTGRVLDDRH